jgi:hypothetical protein
MISTAKALVSTMPSHSNLYSCLTLVLSASLFGYSKWLYASDKHCVQTLYPWSPALEAVRYTWINYADWYYPTSRFRGDPSSKPEVEDHWNDYTYSKSFLNSVAQKTKEETDGVISVPYDKLLQFDIPSDFEHWPLSPMEGGGVAAVPSVFYHTNCLVSNCSHAAPGKIQMILCRLCT